MSHTTTFKKVQFRSAPALRRACTRLGLPQPEEGQHKLYAGHVRGLGVKLPGWRFPVVAEEGTGNVLFDNYDGAWGKQSELDRLAQAYSVEAARLFAEEHGYQVTEQAQEDGSVLVEVYA